ncbi:hypothetical protein GCM10023187_52730 [Nibrella viscosa]|uniref:WD40 repeat domain-containing protein n=1 Tax=Nibrella viscosa TaxID=1084524 RepID=A0ABP8KYU1_9BACT
MHTTAGIEKIDLSATPIAGHLDSINALALSSDGQWLATAGLDGIKVWELATGRVLRTLTIGHSIHQYIQMYHLSFSPDNKQLYFAFDNGWEEVNISSWEVATGQLIDTIVLPEALQPGSPHDYGWVNGHLAVLWWDEEKHTIYNIKTWQVLFSVPASEQTSQWPVYLSPDGATLIVHDRMNQTLTYLALQTGQEIAHYPFEHDFINAFALSSKGNLLAVVETRSNRAIQVIDVETGYIQVSIPLVDGDYVNRVCLRSDGQMLVGCGSRGQLKMWDTASAQLVWECTGILTDRFPNCLAINGQQLAIGMDSYSHTMVWDAQQGSLLFDIYYDDERDPYDKVDGVGFDEAGNRLIFIGRGRVYIIDTQSGQELKKQSFRLADVGYNDSFPESAYFPPESNQVVTTYENGTIAWWDINVGPVLYPSKPPYKGLIYPDPLRTIAAHSKVLVGEQWLGGIASLCFSTDGSQLYSAGLYDRQLKHWHVANTQLLNAVALAQIPAQVYAIHQSHYLVVMLVSNTVEIRHADTFELLAVHENVGFYTDALFTPLLTPDGRFEIYPYWRCFFVRQRGEANNLGTFAAHKD